LNYALAALTAILLILTFPRFDLIWLAPIALTPLLIALAREASHFRRALLGYLCGVIYWFGVCYWIQFVLSFYGGLGEIAGWAVFLLFCLAKAAHMAVFALLAGIFIRKWWAIPAIASAWVAVEVSHGRLGFAWLALGNAGVTMGVPMRLAPWTGVYGLSFIFVMMATALTLAILRRPRRELLWFVLLAPLAALPRLPDWRPGAATAVLVQPNVSETEKWTDDAVEKLERRLVYLSITAARSGGNTTPDLLIWPEVPAPLYEDDLRFRRLAADLARLTHANFLLGVVARAPDGGPLNSALMISPAGEVVSRYDKVNLVPFGEFVPWPFGFANKISTEVGDFRAGSRVVVSPVGNHKLGTFICYESVFPNFVRRFAAAGAELLVNISNDSWFGKSAARQQHLSIVRMRAAENRRWILRATNDGITATIDPAGRLLGTLPNYTEAASRTGYSYISEKTFYTLHGDWFAACCGIGAIAAAFFALSRRRSS
jgi:apolipoprotein N-acyltransferase